MTEEFSDTYLRRFKNLIKFRKDGSGEGGRWTDEEIREYLRNRPKRAKPTKTVAVVELTQEESDIVEYDKLFKIRLKAIQKEYGVDLNDSNDYESLNNLVRLQLQQEVVDRQIRTMSSNKVLNTKSLKDLGDYQRSLQMSIAQLQQELGISRKARKEKNIDDLPKEIANLKERARDFFDRNTTKIVCPNDQIELARVWLNFPKLKNEFNLELECWKCHEVIIYAS